MATRDVSLRHFKISPKDRENITSNMAMLLGAAVPVGEVFTSLEQTSRPRLRPAFAQVRRAIDSGVPFSEALKTSGIITEQTYALAVLGEEGGTLVQNLEIAAAQEEKHRVLQSKIRTALMYPTFVIGLTFIIGLAIAWLLLPRLADTFAQLGVKLPLITRVLIGIGDFLKHNGVWFVPCLIAAIGLFVYVGFIAPKTKRFGQRLLMQMPGISRLIREIEAARLGYLLGTLLNSGILVTHAMRMLGRATNNVEYRNFYNYLLKSFDDGYGIQQSFSNYPHIDRLYAPELRQIIIAGEKSGALPQSLISIGRIYESKSDASAANLEAILEPVLLIVVWLGVMAVAVAVILPVYSLVGGLQQ